jgi:hypothetical protein
MIACKTLTSLPVIIPQFRLARKSRCYAAASFAGGEESKLLEESVEPANKFDFQVRNVGNGGRQQPTLPL